MPPGVDPHSCPVDPYLLASKLTADAILAYHTALGFHGKAHSLEDRYLYLTEREPRPFTFRSYHFRGVRFPKELLRKRQASFGVLTAERMGLAIRVTCLERALVDVFDRPDLGGGWEEIWRSLEAVEFFDLDQVVRYALLLGNATTAAKVGFYLEQHREALMVQEAHLKRLREHRPQKPHYIDRTGRQPRSFVKNWNLVVPQAVLERSWQEVI